jgi:low affinity Fe/Cu permease
MVSALVSNEVPAMKINELFRKFSHCTSQAAGSPWAFMLAVLTIIVWGITGPACGFSETWQLVINTGTTIITFLMVFLVQNTQNRDSMALHLKLDELIRSLDAARNGLIDIEDLSDEEIKKLQDSFQKLRAKQGEDVSECIDALEGATNEELVKRKDETEQDKAPKGKAKNSGNELAAAR